MNRQRVTPALRVSLILGRTLSNVVTIGVQAVLLTAVAIPFGLYPNWVGILLAILLICVLALGMASASYAVGLIVKDEDSFAPMVQGVSLPLLLLSGVLLPMTLAPPWLRRLSEANPLSYLVNAVRALFRGELATHDIGVGVAVTVVLTMALSWWGARTFQRSSA